MRTSHRPPPLATALACAGLACALLATTPAAAATKPKAQAQADSATLAELVKKIDALAAQNKALQEKVDKLEEFVPERMAGRILGQGDMMGVV